MNYKIIYQLREFGLTPGKLLSRFLVSCTRPIIANSLPKSGTNLLSRALSFVPAAYRIPRRTLSIPRYNESKICDIIQGLKNNQIAVAHLRYSHTIESLFKDSNICHFLMFRDLRDVIVSAAHYIGSMDKSHEGYEVMHNLPMQDRISLFLGEDKLLQNKKIQSRDKLFDFAEEVRSFTDWLSSENILVIKYENLIGSEGGGTSDAQLTELTRIADYIGWKTNKDELIEIAGKIYYTKSKTFRKGGQGGWKNYFTEYHKSRFKILLGNELVKLGYERDMNW